MQKENFYQVYTTFNSDFISNMDHMRILGTEKVILA